MTVSHISRVSHVQSHSCLHNLCRTPPYTFPDTVPTHTLSCTESLAEPCSLYHTQLSPSHSKFLLSHIYTHKVSLVLSSLSALSLTLTPGHNAVPVCHLPHDLHHTQFSQFISVADTVSHPVSLSHPVPRGRSHCLLTPSLGGSHSSSLTHHVPM